MALYKWDVRIAGIGSFPDQIQYLTQAEYDDLSEEEKMNGTSYWIIGETEPAPVVYEDVMAYLHNHTFGAWSLDSWVATNDWYVQFTFNRSDVSNCYINWILVYAWMVYYTTQTARSPIFRIYKWDTVSWWNGMTIMYETD